MAEASPFGGAEVEKKSDIGFDVALTRAAAGGRPARPRPAQRHSRRASRGRLASRHQQAAARMSGRLRRLSNCPCSFRMNHAVQNLYLALEKCRGSGRERTFLHPISAP